MSQMLVNPYIFGFTPLSIPNLVGWWDSNADETITPGAGSEVQEWDSKTGAGLAWVQPTASFRPVTLDVSGRQMISFDGSDNRMSNNDGGGGGGGGTLQFADGEFSIYVVYRTPDTNRGLILHRGLFSPAGYFMRINDADSDNGDFPTAIRDGSSNLANVVAVGTFNDDTVRMVSMVRNNTSDLLLQEQDGSSSGSTSTSLVGDIDDAATLAWLGSFNATSQFYEGEVGDILMFDRALDATEHANVVAFLKDRWGIA